jgi:alpha-glucosidase
MADHAWWQRGVLYQVYPRSFQDSNADGIGDLRGILRRVDYLEWLGVTGVWISPIYPSPMADFGYDVCNYTAIDPLFGSLEDFDELLRELHGRDIKVILDFVPNHTSLRHPWFEASRSSRTNARRHWYIWRDPAPDGGPPTNWQSEFGGPAWTFDAPTGQYYYHAYLPEQPDLNWRSPEVRAAMYNVLRFWLKRGVDGFRVDAIHMLIEDESFLDNPPNPAWQPGQSPARRLLRTYTADLAETHVCVAGMRRVLDEYPDRVLIGEAYLPIPRLMLYYGESLSGFQLPFNFHLIGCRWNAPTIASLVREYELALPDGGWPNWVLGNHDKSRVVTRLGGIPQAKLAALLLLSLRGTPTIYNGEEIGMADGEVPADRVQDPWERNVPGLGLGRDPCRTPMLWDEGANAGFTDGTPWLPINPPAAGGSVAAQQADDRSMLSLYRRLIRLRRQEPAIAVGDYREVAVTEDVFVFERSFGARRLWVALNFSASFQHLATLAGAAVLLSTGARSSHSSPQDAARLEPYEGLIAEAPL